MAGKLTDDRMMSCSRLPALLGHSPYSTPNDELRKSLAAIRGEPEQWDGNEATRWGDALEPLILQAAIDRVKIPAYELSPRKPVQHKALPLAGSLDGIAYGCKDEVRSDPERGIYVVGQDSIRLDGPGALEAKLTSEAHEDVPALHRGPIQAQGLMLCGEYRWAAIAVLYRGVELRVFLFAPHLGTMSLITREVELFDAKLKHAQVTGVVPWYEPHDSADANRTWPRAETDDPIILPDRAAELAAAVRAAEARLKGEEAAVDRLQAELKAMLQTHKRGYAGQYVISWPMRNYQPQPEKVVPAKPGYAIRQSTITIRERKGEAY